MTAVSVKLDADLEARVSKYADGIGIPVETVLERALIFALKTRYDAVGPDNSLPGRDKPTDPGYDKPTPGRPDQGLPPGATTKPGSDAGRPDQSLPGSGASTKPGSDASRPDQSLPAGSRCPVFDPEVEQDLPDEDIPEEC